MSLLLTVWVKAMRLKEVSWRSSGQNSGVFVCSESLGLGPCLFLDNSLPFNMLDLSQVWASNSPQVTPLGQRRASSEHSDPSLQTSGFQKVACPFCESNTWYKISNYRHQILSPWRSETASHSLLRPFIFIGKLLPNIGHISLPPIHAFYLFWTRHIMLPLLDDQAIHFQGHLYTMLLLDQCAVQSAPKVFLRSWQNHCDLSQQRPYNFKEM